MSVVRLSLVLMTLFIGSNALAASQFAPMGPLSADGEKPATIHLVLDNPNSKVRVKIKKGKVLKLTPVAGGYAISYLPPTVSVPTEVTLTAIVKNPDRHKEIVTTQISILPPVGGSFAISFDPPSVRPGGSSQVTVRPDQQTLMETRERQLRATVSSGELTALIPAGDGSWVGRYTAPSDLTEPSRVVVAVADLSATSPLTAGASLAIVSNDTITLDATPGSQNILTVGGRAYGPNPADIEGHVSFDLEVNPDHSKGSLESVPPGGVSTTTEVEIPTSLKPVFALAPSATKAPMGSQIQIDAYCAAASGAPCDAAAFTWTTDVPNTQTVTAGKSSSQLTVTQDTAITATLAEQSTRVDITALAAPVLGTLTSSPPMLTGKSNNFKLSARVKDASGVAATGRMPTLVVDEARRTRRLKDNRDGTYTADYKLKATGTPAHALMIPDLAATGLPPARLISWPSAPFVQADGSSKVSIVIVAVDALGAPVPNVDLTIAVPLGDGASAPKLNTGKTGVTKATYTAGNQAGLSAVVVDGAGLQTVSTIWQSPPDTAVSAAIPTGNHADLALVETWQSYAGVLVVGHDIQSTPTGKGGTPIAAAPLLAAMPGQRAATSNSGASDGTGQGGQVRQSAKAHWLRSRVNIVNAPFKYTGTTEATSGLYPETASFNVSPWFGAAGIEAAAEGWMADLYGADVSIRFSGFSVNIAEETLSTSVLDLYVGGRYKAWEQGQLTATVGMGYFQSSEILFAYTNEQKSAATFEKQGVKGGRIDADLRIAMGSIYGKLSLSQVLSPMPSVSAGNLSVDIPLPDSMVGLNIGGGLSYHANTLTGSDSSEIKAKRLGSQILLGATYNL
jgi:hypothetical protein